MSMTIQEIKKEYLDQIDSLDLDLILAHVLRKNREFVLSHPEAKLTKEQTGKIKRFIKRRLNQEPLAYILGHKEFFGFDFLVNKNTLIPRPETELIIEKILSRKIPSDTTIIDIGTGSGNIIIALAKNFKKTKKYLATDISKEALKVTRKNIQRHRLKNKIKVIHSNLLNFLFEKKNKIETKNLIVVANLPYLSKKVYAATKINVKKFEPKSALYSSDKGLAHYKKLLRQIAKLKKTNPTQSFISCYLEFSPEQKNDLEKIIRNIFPEKIKIEFHRDLAQKWRFCEITL